MEAPEEQTVALYDFIYKDDQRIISWYAQIFGGRIFESEKTTTSAETVSNEGKVGAFNLLTVSQTTLGVETQQRKDRSDPGDVITTDLLAYLIQNGHIKEDIDSANHGDLVIVKGKLFLVDGTVIEIIKDMFDNQAQELSKSRNPVDKQTGINLRYLASAIRRLVFPPAFFLDIANDKQVVGTLHIEGMRESIPSYAFRHGSSSIGDVFCIGIKEDKVEDSLSKLTDMMSGITPVTENLGTMLFDPSSIRVTPIVLFRKIL